MAEDKKEKPLLKSRKVIGAITASVTLLLLAFVEQQFGVQLPVEIFYGVIGTAIATIAGIAVEDAKVIPAKILAEAEAKLEDKRQAPGK